MDSPSAAAVMVLDDDAFSRYLSVECLRQLGYSEIHECGNAADALGIINSGGINLAICDLDMPGQDGVDFLRELGLLNVPVSIVILSGVAGDLLETSERMAGFLGLTVLGALTKPLQRNQLAAVLANQPMANVAELAPLLILSEQETRQLIQGSVEPHYQPKVSLVDAHIVGAEVLVRAPSVPDFNAEQFIHSVEKYGLSKELTAALVPRIIADVRAQSAIIPHLRVSMNLSASELTDLELPNWLAEQLQTHGLAPERLIVELTETSDLPDLVASMDVLTRLRLKGFGLALDDFGTGYASFDKLMGLPFTEVKLDRALLADARTRHRGRVVFESAATMAQKLALMCTAEGVETEEDQRMAIEAGCTVGQGYFYGPAIPQAEFLAWADSWSKQQFPDTP